jgi:hypothetical protein
VINYSSKMYLKENTLPYFIVGPIQPPVQWVPGALSGGGGKLARA